MGETVLKVKVPPVRIENPLSPLYRGTDFTTLAETFQTVWGGGEEVKSNDKGKGWSPRSSLTSLQLAGTVMAA